MFLKFPSIESFDRVMAHKAWKAENAADRHQPEFILRPKVKLHGVNLGIGVGPEGGWIQSRKTVLSAQDDLDNAHKSLSAVMERLLAARAEEVAHGHRILVFGEWAGAGIQKKDAVTAIGRKAFFPFLVAVTPPDYAETDDVRADRRAVSAYTAPEQIRRLIGFEDDMVIVLPWAGPAVRFSSDDLDATGRVLDAVNASAEAVGEQDPFIKAMFGVEGPGEGLVFVPDTATGAVSLEDYSNLTFKAKAERHRVKASAKAATVRAEIPANALAFADAFATENRMEQMLSEKLGGEADKRRTGEFVKAVVSDVMKESVPERAALGVDDKVISGLISKRASAWFVERAENSWRPTP